MLGLEPAVNARLSYSPVRPHRKALECIRAISRNQPRRAIPRRFRPRIWVVIRIAFEFDTAFRDRHEEAEPAACLVLAIIRNRNVFNFPAVERNPIFRVLEPDGVMLLSAIVTEMQG